MVSYDLVARASQVKSHLKGEHKWTQLSNSSCSSTRSSRNRVPWDKTLQLLTKYEGHSNWKSKQIRCENWESKRPSQGNILMKERKRSQRSTACTTMRTTIMALSARIDTFQWSRAWLRVNRNSSSPATVLSSSRMVEVTANCQRLRSKVQRKYSSENHSCHTSRKGTI